ncbi:MAG TPA: hypothetical protein VIK86_09375, partial [Candidatus Paceibacterota bacterium]
LLLIVFGNISNKSFVTKIFITLSYIISIMGYCKIFHINLNIISLNGFILHNICDKAPKKNKKKEPNWLFLNI